MARALYSLLLRLATPLYLLRLVWRSRREPVYRERLLQRLGLRLPPLLPGALWVHAVSLGETLAARTLIDALRAQQPGLRLLLTTSTATGAEAGRALLQAGDAACWFPFDTPGAVRRFLSHARPAGGVLMETEIWPNLMHAAQQTGMPVLLANARLSERSLRRGQSLRALMAPAAHALTLAMAQTEADAQRVRAFGVSAVQVCGNLKFDIHPDPALIERGCDWRRRLDSAQPRPVLIAAVTREGEEAMLLQAWAQREPQAAPDPLLLIVPRHPQRFDEVAAQIQAAGLTLARRSAWADAPPPSALQAQVWLGDSMREMPIYYAMSDVALLGGSFAPLGGQNLIEAAACGCPVVMGPHTFNFADAARQCIAAGAAVRVDDIAAGVHRARTLAVDPALPDWQRHAVDFAAAHRGAAQRMAGLIGACLATASTR
jgi:3-deoxy-D-manno-octulosonic-acid transferase